MWLATTAWMLRYAVQCVMLSARVQDVAEPSAFYPTADPGVGCRGMDLSQGDSTGERKLVARR